MAIKFLKTLNANDEKGRRGRWVEYLQQFDMELVHRSGVSKELAIADYLSRVDRNGGIMVGKIMVVKVNADGDVPLAGFLSTEKLKAAQEADAEIREWRRSLHNSSGGKPWKFMSNLVQDEEGIMRIIYVEGRKNIKTDLGNIERYRIVVHKAMREDVVRFVHASPTCAHMGYRRTYKRCRENFWWQGMGVDIRRILKMCEQCGKNKH